MWELTTDDVWAVLVERGVPKPREPRAMGPRMLKAVRDGIIQPTTRFRPSMRPETHRNPKRVYTSVAKVRR